MQLWHPAYVGLGSNLEDPLAQVRRALAELAQLPATRLVARSRLYRSAPLGPPEQPDYVNAVAGLLTHSTPQALLAALQVIEQRHGRTRSAMVWGPRTLDLDLLLYGDSVLADEALLLPHPQLHQRAFVIVPLAEIAPDVQVPGHGRAATLAARLTTADLVPLE